METNFENRFATFTLSKGIAYVHFRQATRLGFYHSQRLVSVLLRLQKGQPCPLLLDMDAVVAINKPARDYLARSGRALFPAVALVATTQAAVATGLFYIRVSKPVVPTRIFSDVPSAVAFLKSYM